MKLPHSFPVFLLAAVTNHGKSRQYVGTDTLRLDLHWLDDTALDEFGPRRPGIQKKNSRHLFS